MKKYVILNSKGGHEFDLLVADEDAGTRYQLTYAPCAPWNEHVWGTPALTIIDDGNGLVLDDKYKGFDYAKAEYFRVLLKAMQLVEPRRHDSFVMVEFDNMLKL